jgi:hypothetical protein
MGNNICCTEVQEIFLKITISTRCSLLEHEVMLASISECGKAKRVKASALQPQFNKQHFIYIYGSIIVYRGE